MHKQNRKSNRGQDNNSPPTQLIGGLARASYQDTDGVYKDTITDEPLDPQPFTDEWHEHIKTREKHHQDIENNICPDCGAALFKIPAYYGTLAEVAVSCTSCIFHARLLVRINQDDEK